MENPNNFFFVFFCQIGNFFVELGKNILFWHWVWGGVSAPKLGDREPCSYLNTWHLSGWEVKTITVCWIGNRYVINPLIRICTH